MLSKQPIATGIAFPQDKVKKKISPQQHRLVASLEQAGLPIDACSRNWIPHSGVFGKTKEGNRMVTSDGGLPRGNIERGGASSADSLRYSENNSVIGQCACLPGMWAHRRNDASDDHVTTVMWSSPLSAASEVDSIQMSPRRLREVCFTRTGHRFWSCGWISAKQTGNCCGRLVCLVFG